MDRIRRGAATGWIVLVVIIGLLVAYVGYRMIHNQQTSDGRPTATRPAD